MYIVYVKSDILTNWINGPTLLGTNVVHLSGEYCTFKEVWSDKMPTTSKLRLCSYLGEFIAVLACANVEDIV